MAKETLIIEIRADGTRIVKREITGIGKESKKSAKGVEFLKNALRAVAGIVIIRQTFKLADAYTVLQNRLRVVTNGTDDLNNATRRLQEISVATRSDLKANAELFSRLSIASSILGASQEELFDFTESLNKAIKLSGASAQEARGGLIQLSQGISSARLSGDELRTVLEQLPVVADVIAKSLKVTRGELRQLGKEGKITGRVILKAFKEAREELDERFGKTIPTIAEGFVLLGNSLSRLVGEFSEATFAGRGLFQLLKDLSGVLDFLTEDLERTENKVTDALQTIIEKGGRAAEIARQLQKRRNIRRGGVVDPAIAQEEKQQRLLSGIFEKLINQRQQEAQLLRASGDDRAVLAQRLKTENELRKIGIDIFSEESQAALNAADLSARGNVELSRRAKLVEQILGPERERLAIEKALTEAVEDKEITDVQRTKFLEKEVTAVAELNKFLADEITLLKLSSVEAEIRAALLEAENALLDDNIDKNSKRGQAVLASAEADARSIQLLRERNSVLAAAGPTEDEQLLRRQAINIELDKGRIGQAEANLQLKALAVASVEAGDGLGGLANAFRQVDTSARAVGESIGSSFVQAIGQASNALAEFIVEGGKGVKSLEEQITGILKNLLKQIIATIIQTLILRAITGSIGGGAPGGGGGNLGVTRAIRGFQAGGPVRRDEPVVVGERGRELFVPPSNGRIERSSQMQAPQLSVTIVNATDEDQVLAAIGSSAGEELILNTINNNPETVKRAVG